MTIEIFAISVAVLFVIGVLLYGTITVGKPV